MLPIHHIDKHTHIHTNQKQNKQKTPTNAIYTDMIGAPVWMVYCKLNFKLVSKICSHALNLSRENFVVLKIFVPGFNCKKNIFTRGESISI